MRARMPRSVSWEFWHEVRREDGWHEVTVCCRFTPGFPPQVSGPPDSWDEGCPDEVEIVRVVIDLEAFELTEDEMEKVEEIALREGGEQWNEMKWGDE